ncbi:unnamed protein product [Cochlearia groenlandica]
MAPTKVVSFGDMSHLSPISPTGRRDSSRSVPRKKILRPPEPPDPLDPPDLCESQPVQSLMVSVKRYGQKRSLPPSSSFVKRDFPPTSLFESSQRGDTFPVSNPRKCSNTFIVLSSCVAVYTRPKEATEIVSTKPDDIGCLLKSQHMVTIFKQLGSTVDVIWTHPDFSSYTLCLIRGLLMDSLLDGKIVIITGGASGIGAEAARLFTEHGAKVVIVDFQEELGQNVAVSIGLEKACFYRCDVTNETDVENAVKFAVAKHGKLDVLFSNAGVMEQSGSILDLDLEMFDRTFSVNVRGAAAFIKHAARAMVEKGTRGSIVCTTSVAAEIGGQGPHAYTASKHALLGLVKSSCGGLGKYGIRVNGVAPFAVATNINSHDEETARMVEGYGSATGILKGVVLKASHVAQAALFLASDDSAYVSGQNLAVDGGFTVVKPI